MKISKKDITIHVSGNFMCDNYPEDYDELSEEDLFAFIRAHAWEQFEYMEPKYVWDLIDSAAFALAQFLKDRGIEVTE